MADVMGGQKIGSHHVGRLWLLSTLPITIVETSGRGDCTQELEERKRPFAPCFSLTGGCLLPFGAISYDSRG